MIHLDKENFDELVNTGVHLVDFYADWCGPCKMLAPVLEKITTAEVIKVNTDLHEELARKYGIMSIPTLLYFKDGELKDKTIGFISQEEIEAHINSIL